MEKKSNVFRIINMFLSVMPFVFMVVCMQVQAQQTETPLPGDSSKVLFKKSIKVVNAGRLINTPQNETMALSNVSANSLFYNGMQLINEKKFVFDDQINLAVIFNGTLQKQTIELKKPLNRKKWRKLAGHNPFTKELFLYKNKGGGDLYMTVLNDANRKCPKRLSKNINSRYNETVVATTNDGAEIYFISDRPGGVGGKDIWMCKRGKHDKWEKAVNLGPAINTSQDEGFVWISPDGSQLWFSSQGHQNLGGYDVFVAEKSGERWGLPQNPGMPVNSAYNETSISLNQEGLTGFLVSDRPGGFGLKDIYTVKFPQNQKEFVMAEVDQSIEIMENTIALKGLVFDSITREPLQAAIQITDKADISKTANYTTNPQTGKYLIFLTEGSNSTAVFDANGYLPHIETVSLVNASPTLKLIEKNIALRKLIIGERGIFNNILFEFGKDNLKPESVPELIRIVDLMERYPLMEMEVQGHCDNVGSKTFNQKLSEKRAGSVVRYLTASGIVKSRLSAVGKGEDFPVAPNLNTDGTDNPEGRKLNRRTEFLIQKLN